MDMSGLVRLGTVQVVDEEKRMARVKFESEGLVSGWLYILQHNGTEISVQASGGHSHQLSTAGEHSHPGSTLQGTALSIQTDGAHTHKTDEAPDHDHRGTVATWWVPRVNDKVLCLYLPVFNGDGFILGGV
jgi:phage baseplate assembly protein gpV